MITRNRFACKCCGQNLIKAEVITLCKTIETKVGLPLTINSGYRCLSHNAKIGSKSTSQHVKGNAADITCSNLVKLKQECKKMWDNNEIRGYGSNYPRFVHVDTGGHRTW